MKIMIWLSLFIGLWSTANAQQLSLIDSESRLPLVGVIVHSEDPYVSLQSDAEGRVEVSSLKESKEIQIHFMGYKPRVLRYADLQQANWIIALHPSHIAIDQVVVAANRWKQSSGSIPTKVVSIPSREIELQNPQTAADLLTLSGEVFVQKSQQGGGSPMIRGFATNRLIYTVDGVRMNTAIFRSGNIQNVINLDPFALSSTEVVLGPGSVIYGSDAIGGVMSFETLKPQLGSEEALLVKGKAVARYSSANNERTGHFDLKLGWKKWASVTSFSSWDFGHLRQGSNGPVDYLKSIYPQRIDGSDVTLTQDDPLLQIPTAYAQTNLMQKIRYQASKNWDLNYGFHYSETSPYGRYDRHNRLKDGELRYAEWDYGPQSWMMNYFSAENKQACVLSDQFIIRMAHQQFGESRIDRNMHSDERNQTAESVQAYSVNMDWMKATSGRNKVYYGAEYVLNQVRSEGSTILLSTGQIDLGPARYPEASWQSMGVYVSNEYQLTDRLNWHSGLRYNSMSIDADFSYNAAFYPFSFSETQLQHGALTGSSGLVFRPNNSTLLKANLGTAFRSPNVDDLGKVFDSEPGAVTLPNPDLKPEYAYNIDIGMLKIFHDNIRFEWSAYYTLLNNAMVRRNDQLNGLDSILYLGTMSQIQSIQNAAEARVYGIHTGLEITFGKSFHFLSDFNFQEGEEELDNGSISPSRHAAPWFGVSRLQYQTDKLMLECYVQYQGERSHEDLAVEEQAKTEIYALDELGNTYAPGWYTLNVKASYKLSERISIQSGLENITDQRYRPYSSGISGAGRNFVLAVSARF